MDIYLNPGTARPFNEKLAGPPLQEQEQEQSRNFLLERQSDHEFPEQSPPSSDRHQQSSLKLLHTRGWLYEISSLVLATLALVALVGVLYRYENKPSPRWPLGLSLNTIVSIVSTAFRASLMLSVTGAISQSGWIWFAHRPRPLSDICWYDDASRGSLGSVKLLWKLKFVRSAYIGALITLLALALDPFFQQTIKYQTRSAIDYSQDAQTVTAYAYNGTIGTIDTVSSATDLLPYNMRAAMYTGLFSSNVMTLPTPPFSCPSGNCTWDPFSTLSVSSACTDLTPSMTLNCSDVNGATSAEWCNFVSPDDQLLSEMLNGTTWRTFMMLESYIPRSALPALQSYSNNTAALGVVQWARVTNIMASQGSSSGEAVIMPNTTYDAGRCFFYLSVKQIQAQVANGLYTEQVLQEYNHIPPANATAPPQYTLNGTSYYFRDPWTFDMYGDLIFSPPFANATNFTVTWEAFDILLSSITSTSFLYGNVSTGTSAGLYGGQIPLMLLQSDNVTKAMENMAQDMTTSLRANDTQLLQSQMQNSTILAPDQIVTGRVWVQTIFVTIRWEWLILPLLTLVLAAIFLAIVIEGTRQNMVGIWKSSPLTLLFQTVLVHRH